MFDLTSTTRKLWHASAVSAVLLALAAGTSTAQSIRTDFLQPGEMLQYKVKWNFLRLGTVTVRTARDTTSADTTLYRLQMRVESNPDLPVVSIRETNESTVSTSNLMSLRYHGKHRSGEQVSEICYTYDRAARRAACFERNCQTGSVMVQDTLLDVPPYVEGASLLFYARALVHCGNAVSVPTIVNAKLFSTILDFRGPLVETEVDGVESPVRALKYTGRANWSGGTGAGLSGSFTGWISDDGAAVPLRAEMQVLVGSITIELEQWQRPGWTPPSGLRASTGDNREDRQ